MAAIHHSSCGLLTLWALMLALFAIAFAVPDFHHEWPQLVDSEKLASQNGTPLDQRDSGALCKTYVTQAGETCDAIAKANGISTAQLASFNARSWRFSCALLPQGATICIGPGEPPMPTAKGDAVCGPLVPGAMRPHNWSDLASINPCPADQCVSCCFSRWLSP